MFLPSPRAHTLWRFVVLVPGSPVPVPIPIPVPGSLVLGPALRSAVDGCWTHSLSTGKHCWPVHCPSVCPSVCFSFDAVSAQGITYGGVSADFLGPAFDDFVKYLLWSMNKIIFTNYRERHASRAYYASAWVVFVDQHLFYKTPACNICTGPRPLPVPYRVP